jgi:alkylation response protein AidB-like acyl-CoA dehydrogenase
VARDGEARELLERAAAFARERLAPRAAEVDERCLFPEEGLAGLAELGLLGMLFPREFGGSGTTTAVYAAAVREVAYACASTSVSMLVTNMIGGALYRFGTDAQRRLYLPDLAAGRGAGALALTEPSVGSDAASLRTRAVRDGEDYLIDGEKTFITNGGHARVVLVIAATGSRPPGPGGPATASEGPSASPSPEISAFLVEPGTPGFVVGRAERKMGLRGSDTVALAFDGCRVPARNMLGSRGEGFHVALAALDGGRVGVASQAVGIGRAALDAALRYLRDRPSVLGDALETVQCLLAESATRLDAARLLVERAARLRDQGRSFKTEASMAKLFATEAANQACLRAVQALGEDGCRPEHAVERYLRDVKVTTIYEGTSEVQRLVIARSLLRP